MKTAHKAYGAVDVLVTNVGGPIVMKPFQHFDEKQIAAEVQRSLFPTLWGCRAALPYMLAPGRGTIVNVSSVATKGVNRVPYSAAQGAVIRLTSALAFELGTKNIRVNAVAPGGTTAPPRAVPRNASALDDEERAWGREVVAQTIESSHMKRYGLLREMSAAILFLASDAASYLTGTVLPVTIAFAITGSVPRKKDNPALPVLPAEQIESIHAAYEAGAALVHIHVRNDDESPSSDPDRFAEVRAGGG